MPNSLSLFGLGAVVAGGSSSTAGIGAQATIEGNNDDEWHAVFDVNVLRKGAVLELTRAMAADLLHDGIRVSAVGPGTAATGISLAVDGDMQELRLRPSEQGA